ncbi:MAG TPA: NlpC/P60 family protein [Geobacteraceae bacterium]
MTHSIRLLLLCAILLSIPSFAFAAKTHKVKKNETITSLAKKYHVSVAELKAANHLLHSHVKSGDVLVIPPRTASAKTGTVESASAGSYKVRKGDTLARVAKKTGVAVAELKRLNGLGKGRVKPGQVLLLKEATEVAEALPAKDRKVSLRYADLLNDKEYEQSLAELMDNDVAQQVDLNKSIEMKTDNVNALKSKAYGFLGTRYRFGGTSKNGLDCSAFVQKVFRSMEVSLPRTAREQFERGEEVAPGDLQKGDLVFFRTYASFPSHVGIYLGNNRMIHASSRDRRVVVSTVNTPYYRSRYLGAKRISKINPVSLNLDDLMLGVEEEIADDAMQNDTLGIQASN